MEISFGFLSDFQALTKFLELKARFLIRLCRHPTLWVNNIYVLRSIHLRHCVRDLNLRTADFIKLRSELR